MHLPKEDLQRIIAAALAEDIGAGDITSQLTVPEGVAAEMALIAGQPLVACGMFIPEAVCKQLSSWPELPQATLGPSRVELDSPRILLPQNPGNDVKIRVAVKEGQFVEKDTVLATLGGDARTLLLAERTILNFMQRLSGVATLTRQYVEAVAGTPAVILDTRKTLPGFRMLDKYAVRTGGGENHRIRLDDMVLIKDNHIAVCGGIKPAVEKVRKDSRFRGNDNKIVVECDTLAQVEEALAAKADRILLDNMTLEDMRKAVKMAAGKTPLEASGGISLENVRAVAETGVGYISVGKLTHSALAADIRADLKLPA